MKYCQSCGMPLEENIYGTNKDGSPNEEYCIYCFKEGGFTQALSMEEMAAYCAPFMVKENPELTEEEAKAQLLTYFPRLKRWKEA